MQLKNTNAQRHETFVYEKFELHSNSRIQQHYQSHLILFQDIPRYFKLLRNGLVTLFLQNPPAELDALVATAITYMIGTNAFKKMENIKPLHKKIFNLKGKFDSKK